MYTRASQAMKEILWGETTGRSSIGDPRQHQKSEGNRRICLNFSRFIWNTSPFSRPRCQAAKKTCCHYPGYRVRVSVSDLVPSVEYLGSFSFRPTSWLTVGFLPEKHTCLFYLRQHSKKRVLQAASWHLDLMILSVSSTKMIPWFYLWWIVWGAHGTCNQIFMAGTFTQRVVFVKGVHWLMPASFFFLRMLKITRKTWINNWFWMQEVYSSHLVSLKSLVCLGLWCPYS